MKLLYFILVIGKLREILTEYFYPERKSSIYSAVVYKSTRTTELHYISKEYRHSYEECITYCFKPDSPCKSISVQNINESTVSCSFFSKDVLETTKEKGYLFVTQEKAKCSQSCSLTKNPCGKCKCNPSCSVKSRRQHMCNCIEVAGEARSCQSHFDRGFNLTALYKINPSGNASFFTLCEMSKKELQNEVNMCLFKNGYYVLGNSNQDLYPTGDNKCPEFCIFEKKNGKNEINSVVWLNDKCECLNGLITNDPSGTKTTYCILGAHGECQATSGNVNINGKTVSSLTFSNDLCVQTCKLYSTDNPNIDPNFKLRGIDVVFNAGLCKCALGYYATIRGSDPAYSYCILQLLQSSQTLPNSSVWIPMMTRFSSMESDYWNKDYEAYKNGFGLDNQQWIGLENLHQLTKSLNTDMRIDYSFRGDNTISIIYNNIHVDTEEQLYRFTYSSYDDRGSGEIDRFNSQGAQFLPCNKWWSYTCDASMMYPNSVQGARFRSQVNLQWIRFLLRTY